MNTLNTSYSGTRIGYVPFRPSLHPFDLRNFVYYARTRGLSFEIYEPGREYDVIVLTPQVDITTWARYKGKAKLVYMLVDSYLAVRNQGVKAALRGVAKYAVGEHRVLRFNYREAVKDMCRRADAVICSTQEQKNAIQAYCRNAHIILEFNQEEVRQAKCEYAAGERFNLVWEGRPENVAQLTQAKDALVRLRQKYPVALHVVTDLEYGRHMNRFMTVSVANELKAIFGSYFQPNTVEGNRSLVYLYQWDRETVSRLITGFDIAVIPLNLKDPFREGKPENKLLFFWRMGMPTVVTATPAYCRAMAETGCDLCCKDQDEWYVKLESLIVSEDARRAAAESGKTIAETLYSETRCLEQWDNVFLSLY